MLDHALLKQLSHPDPERRKQAVMALAKTKDRAALPYLAEVHQSDKNAEIRELARKAGVFIVKQGKQHAAPVSTYDDDMDDEDDNYQDDYLLDDEDSGAYDKVKNDDFVPAVSDLDREHAEGLVRQALDVHMRGDNKRAMKYLTQAIEKNPALARDGYTRGLVSTISGLPVEQALASLSLETDKKHQKRKNSNTGSSDPEYPTWGAAFVELAIFFAIQTGITALINFMTVALITREPSSAFIQDPTIQVLNGASVIKVMGMSAESGLSSTIAIFINCVLLHLIARFVMNGEGTLPRLISKYVMPAAIISIFFSIIGVIAAFLTMQNADVLLSSPSNADLTTLSNSYLFFILITFITAIGALFYLAKRVGIAYREGMRFGCITIIIASVVSVIIGVAISMLLASMIINAPSIF